MKCLLFFSVILLSSVFFNIAVYAEVKEGTAESSATVNTNISGNGSVKTHIDVNVNGQRKVLESNQPGTYKVEVKSDGTSSVSQVPQENSEVKGEQAEQSSSPTKAPSKKNQTKNKITSSSLSKIISDFISQVLSLFQIK